MDAFDAMMVDLGEIFRRTKVSLECRVVAVAMVWAMTCWVVPWVVCERSSKNCLTVLEG